MGCTNSKTGATGATEGGEAPPKVMVDGEGQDGAANGNAVNCTNGAEDDEAGKEACNGDVKNEQNEAAPSSEGEGKSEAQNGGGDSAEIQDGGESIQKEDGGVEKSAEEGEAKEEGSENTESRENEEEKAE